MGRVDRNRWLTGLPVLLLAVLAPWQGAAQTVNISGNPETLLDEVTELLVKANKKEGGAFIEEVFAPFWNGPYLKGGQRKELAELAHTMARKRFTAFPDFKDMLATVAAFETKHHTNEELGAWLDALGQAGRSSRKQDLSALLEFSHDLMEGNVLHRTGATEWYVEGGVFRIDRDRGLAIVFDQGDLVWASRTDSSVIKDTRGVYYPLSNEWEGQGGTLTWERAGLSPTATFVKWGHGYSLSLKARELVIDSVSFTDPYFDRILKGTVTDKLQANVTPERASYPRFQSYDLRRRINEILPGVDFEGGFTMQGAKLQGYGSKQEPATLEFKYEGAPLIVATGLLFTIEPDKVSSEDVAINIKLGNDSIYHPAVSLRFIRNKKQLTLIKKAEGLSKAPFYDTYHQLDMYFEELRWNQGDPTMTLRNMQGSTQTRTAFESFDYFERRRYVTMMGIDAVHPLSRVNSFTKQVGDEFSVEEFARYTKLQIAQVKPMLIDLANKGYIHYDTDEEYVKVLPRLRRHILSSVGKVDYDALTFISNGEDGVNGRINLMNHDLTLNGVARVVLSDSQDVRIYPKGQVVTIKKGRDFSFDGVVKAGKLTFHGDDYFFHYDQFLIDLLSVDSVEFAADSFEPDQNGRYRLVRVRNVLEGVKGILEVDAPDNKNGLQEEKYPEYPKFHSTQQSYVHYDRSTIQNGAYTRDGFYFRSDPFVLDSLDNFHNQGLQFDGTLVSAGIFPDIHETLRLQPDYALGFVRPTGDGGLPLYGHKAKFSETITLNNTGLHGAGDLSYLTTIARGEQIVFTPDTTFGMADTMYNGASVSATLNAPNVKGSKVFMRLEPAKEVLMAQYTTSPLTMYDQQAYLYGYTELRPEGMTGGGLVDFTNATLNSKLFDFRTMDLHADTSDFRLTEGDTASIAFRTDNVNASIDLAERIGEFASNGDETKVEFPYNKYICYMDRFKWYMDEGDIELESDQVAAAGNEDLQLTGSNFISIRPDQDSLRFMAPKARYDLKKHLITADEVQYIQVADALITPDSMRVRIRRNAVMDRITNATITANFINKYHRIYQATVDIASRRQYSGTGVYDYTDKAGKTFPIAMSNINVDSTYQTYALGNVPESQGMQLSPAFDFFGNVKLEASSKELTFTGNTRIKHDCRGIPKNWMGFTGKIDPMEVFIPVSDSLIDATGHPVGTGIYLTSEDPFTTYGTFLSRKEDASDRNIISAKGLLYYDEDKHAYMISNKDKIRQAELPGNLVALSTETCLLSADGHINTGVDLGQVAADEYGTLEYRGDQATVATHVTLVVDFPFQANLLDKMATTIANAPGPEPIDLSKTPYERALREVLGTERSDKLISELSLRGQIRRQPDELAKSFVFADMRLEWNAADEAWQSTGRIGLGNVQKKNVFRYVKGKVEFQRRRSGDAMTILLMLDDDTYWFFEYTRTRMSVYSSDEDFNSTVNDLKEDKRKFSGKKDTPDYMYLLTNKRKVDSFRDRFGF